MQYVIYCTISQLQMIHIGTILINRNARFILSHLPSQSRHSESIIFAHTFWQFISLQQLLAIAGRTEKGNNYSFYMYNHSLQLWTDLPKIPVDDGCNTRVTAMLHNVDGMIYVVMSDSSLFRYMVIFIGFPIVSAIFKYYTLTIIQYQCMDSFSLPTLHLLLFFQIRCYHTLMELTKRYQC